MTTKELDRKIECLFACLDMIDMELAHMRKIIEKRLPLTTKENARIIKSVCKKKKDKK